ncbi:MAG: peptide ABC transporter substrate-binding protein [Fusobacteriia bacterium 4572_132]|nr:MAG: peptide ABC transporter substrate-binding protein [Fusobacteriia bacterium 4572_132]
MEDYILEVENLKKYFPIKAGILQKTVNNVKAVDGVTFKVKKGETLGIVGESGCGKSTTGRVILQLLQKTDGNVKFEGKEITDLKKEELRKLRKDMQIIFQDPYASLNPRMKIGTAIGEVMEIHGIATGTEKIKKVKELLTRVGLQSEYINRYPHEFSGGQRQRVGIARALAANPKIILCDEAVSALDVSVQAQVLNLLEELQEERGLTYLFIAHDLSVVRHISDRIAVMYLGEIVELADKETLYESPKHPYTRALLSAIPVADPTVKKERILLEGDIPSPINPPSGCKFSTRCPYAKELCREKEPETREIKKGHFVACHFSGEFGKNK